MTKFHQPSKMHFGNEVEMTFSTLWNGFVSDESAKQERDSLYNILRRRGIKVRRSVLRSQMREYWGFGEPCGEICNVYRIRWIETGDA